ncbi:MAG: thioredoxin family protein [Bacteroidia bacterium]|nr:thioredoxin family protein [Bacteroidia bacterium]
MKSPINWPKGLSYQDYLLQVNQLVADGLTSGPTQDEFLSNFTRLNAHRMKRLGKTVKLLEMWDQFLPNLQKSYTWRVFTEAWCGDAAQILPVLQAIGLSSGGKITLEVFYRDEDPELFSHFLTGDSKAIPKLVAIDNNSGEQIGTWGPRPSALQDIVLAHKENPQVSHSELVEQLQRWYNEDGTRQIQEEIFRSLQTWEKK